MNAQQKFHHELNTVTQSKPQLRAVVDKTLLNAEPTNKMMPEKQKTAPPIYDFVGVAG